ncbi:AI-2E family transporter [Ferruginibacter profundus]
MTDKTTASYPVLKYLQGIILVTVLLYFGKTLLVPLFLGLLIAMIMYPVCKWLEDHGWHKVFSISAGLLIVGLLFAGLFFILAWQLNMFSKDAPVILKKLDAVVLQMQAWLSEGLGINTKEQSILENNLSTSAIPFIKSAVQNAVNTVFMLFLTPVYTALFLYHRKIFVQSLRLLIAEKYKQKFDSILHQVIKTYFNYIKGMITVYLVVGTLNSLGLFFFGVKQPVLFGMVCAIMTIFPYIGTFVSASLPVSMIWMQTGNIWYPLGLIAMFSFVQYLEANVIYPKAVGTQLHVSTMAMLIAMIAGGIIWGVAGMVLFIPFVSILKIISDNIEEWKPLNLLLSRK